MKVWVGFILVGCFLAFGIFWGASSSKGQKEYEDQPTVVRRGEQTATGKEYSKAYQKQYSRRGQELTKLLESAKRRGSGKEIGVAINVPSIPTLPNEPEKTAEEFLNDLACYADAVVLGSVHGKAAHLTEDETLIYTQYEFSVKDIFKNNSKSPIRQKESIDVTRPGGLISLEGQVIRFEDRSFEQLQLQREYLLFLRYIPEANGYVVSDARGDFRLLDDSFQELSKRGIPASVKSIRESEAFLRVLRASSFGGCALDRNGDGAIDSGKELFGNVMPQGPGPLNQRNGFRALALYDGPGYGGDNDRKIARHDAIFDRLRLWQDTNHNGVSENCELFGLRDLGLRSIDLDYVASERVDAHGNEFRYRSRVRDTNNEQLGRWAWDVFLVVQQP